MMANSKLPAQPNPNNSAWDAEAWVYFVWVIIGKQVYCKIGCSSNLESRIEQVIAAIPERPFLWQGLACLNVEQAQLFESLFHEHLSEFRTKGGWYTHANVTRLYNALGSKVKELLSTFRSFNFEPYFINVDLDGRKPA